MSTPQKHGGHRTRGWRNRSIQAACALLVLLACAPGAFPNEGPTGLRRVGHDELCVTNGEVTTRHGRFAIDTPSSRAVVRPMSAAAADQVAQIRFRYLGPSTADKPLASGQLRRQIGLKLGAENTCNLIYVMWHIAPDARIAVSIKRNPGMHLHSQCGAHGYVFVKAPSRVEPPSIRPGETHTLRAALHGRELTVVADDKPAWHAMLDGTLPAGPAGFRTDNVRARLEYAVGADEDGDLARPASSALSRCRAVADE